MTCSFCGARNNEGETRCRKCGRKPGDSLNGQLAFARTEGALATKMEPAHFQADAVRPRPAIRGVQQQLFPGESKVVPIELYAPPRAEPKPQPQPRKSAPRRRPVPEGQGALDFLPPETPKPRTLNTTVEAMVSCDFPVAPHRAIASAIDCSLVLIGYGIFLAVYFALGGEFAWSRLNLEIFGGAFLLVALSYGLIWALAGSETAGMAATGLRLTTFEGFPLEPKQRIVRFVAGCLSLCTVLGHLWSLADEESLTWHDHISRTFPTPRRVRAEVFRRV